MESMLWKHKTDFTAIHYIIILIVYYPMCIVEYYSGCSIKCALLKGGVMGNLGSPGRPHVWEILFQTNICRFLKCQYIHVCFGIHPLNTISF